MSYGQNVKFKIVKIVIVYVYYIFCIVSKKYISYVSLIDHAILERVYCFLKKKNYNTYLVC